MGRQAGIFLMLGILLTLAGSASALIRPPADAVLPDYDARLKQPVAPADQVLSRGPALGGTGLVEGVRSGFFEPSPEQTSAVARIKTAGSLDKVEVRWDPRTGYPRSLFSYSGFLTPSSTRPAAEVASDFLHANRDLYGMTQEAANAFSQLGGYSDRVSGASHVQLQQYVGGYPVFEGLARFNLNRDNRIVSAHAATPLQTLTTTDLTFEITAETAIRQAAAVIGYPLATAPARKNAAGEMRGIYEPGPFLDDITVMPLVFPLGGKGRPAWMVWLDSPGYPAYYQVIIDAKTGEMVHRFNMTKYSETDGRVFVHDPVTDGFSGMVLPFSDATVNIFPESPLGWVWESPSPLTLGNNVDAKLDREADNETTIGFRATGQIDAGPPKKIHFDFAFTNQYETTGAVGDTSAALTQALYVASDFHDWAYDLGFDEAAGNYQEVNHTPNGVGGDPVYLDVQDSASRPASWQTRNNANFSTQPDGQPGRGQFFLWMNPYPRRDSIFDAEVVQHELIHGMSNRVIGGPGRAGYSSCISGAYGGAMGEGWSDFFTLTKGNDTKLGEYTTGDTTNGIRSAPIDANTYTLSDFCHITFLGVPDGMCETHNNGEIWGGTLWDMRTLLIAADPANGRRMAEQLAMDGMKMSMCGPTFNDMRDAILLADEVDYGGVHRCIIWKAFADRGMGVNSVILHVDDDAPVEDFTSPCDSGQGAIALNASRFACSGSGTVTVSDNNATAPVNVTLTSATAGDTLVLALPQSGSLNTFSGAFTLGPDSGSPNPADSVLEVADADTITAQYADTNPSAQVEVTADTVCAGPMKVDYRVTDSSCGDDVLPEFPKLRGFLDGGETANLVIIVENPLEIDIHNARITLATTNPKVKILNAGPVAIGTLEGLRGTSPAEKYTAAFPVAVSPTVAAGDTAVFQITFQSDEFVQLAQSSVTVTLNKDYQLASGLTSPVENFDASGNFPADWGFFDFAPPSNEWNVVTCAGASGTNSVHDGATDCVSDYGEASSSMLFSNNFTYVQPGVVEAWMPTAFTFKDNIDLGSAGANSEQVGLWINETDPVNGNYTLVGLFDPSGNTGGSWVNENIPLDSRTFATFDLETGVRLIWIMYRDGTTASTGRGYFVDDFSMTYDAARIVDQTGPCADALTGDLTSCALGMTISVYNTKRAAERQYADNGAFFLEAPSNWAVMESEFPTQNQPGDTVVLVVSDNPDDGAHQGVMAVNAQTVPSPKPNLMSFGTSTCAPIPVPVPGSTNPKEGSTFMLTWSAFPESGTGQAIVGYEVWRLDASVYPAATSTINNYVNNGTRVGDTVGQANINQFQETAPLVTVNTPFTYVIRPIFGRSGGTMPAEFGDGEGAPGKANISTDSAIVTVEDAFFVEFDFWKAERKAGGVEVTWGTRTEIETDGFYVLKGSAADASTLSPAHTLPITATGGGSTYSFLDTGAPAGTDVYYQILELTSSGEPSRTPIFTLDNAGRTMDRRRTAGRGSVSAPDSPTSDRSVNRGRR